jgi:hypothetical protein
MQIVSKGALAAGLSGLFLLAAATPGSARDWHPWGAAAAGFAAGAIVGAAAASTYPYGPYYYGPGYGYYYAPGYAYVPAHPRYGYEGYAAVPYHRPYAAPGPGQINSNSFGCTGACLNH